MKFTQAQLKELFHYDPATGEFTGKTEGFTPYVCGTSGYVIIIIGRKCCRAHRLVWVYVTGEQPPNIIDHKNQDKTDNRWSNLREATPSQSSSNRRGWGKSGVKGVRQEGRKWLAQGQKDGKTIRLGLFATIEEASAAYENHTKQLAGEFFRP